MPREREVVCGGCSVLSWMNFVLLPRRGRHVGVDVECQLFLSDNDLSSL